MITSIFSAFTSFTDRYYQLIPLGHYSSMFNMNSTFGRAALPITRSLSEMESVLCLDGTFHIPKLCRIITEDFYNLIMDSQPACINRDFFIVNQLVATKYSKQLQ